MKVIETINYEKQTIKNFFKRAEIRKFYKQFILHDI